MINRIITKQPIRWVTDKCGVDIDLLPSAYYLPVLEILAQMFCFNQGYERSSPTIGLSLHILHAYHGAMQYNFWTMTDWQAGRQAGKSNSEEWRVIFCLNVIIASQKMPCEAARHGKWGVRANLPAKYPVLSGLINSQYWTLALIHYIHIR